MKYDKERIRFEKNVMSEYLDRNYFDRHARIAIKRIAREGLT
ncbi:conserved hypothetical protein [Methanothermobacter sp. MT-2]|nr:conserved hypothetical protein [Methanothermobacter sp. MT-2]HPQ05352.1 hypothetical protein [Methanothermobacter sp.]HPQ05457.1 hypothetical protein [Methanothermobacter sp.]HPU36385.1 hypothetical protein [Methanothermobacter sp.]